MSNIEQEALELEKLKYSFLLQAYSGGWRKKEIDRYISHYVERLKNGEKFFVNYLGEKVYFETREQQLRNAINVSGDFIDSLENLILSLDFAKAYYGDAFKERLTECILEEDRISYAKKYLKNGYLDTKEKK